MAAGSINGTPAGEKWRELSTYVADRLWAGQAPVEISHALVERGLSSEAARAIVATVEERLREGGAL